MHHVAPGTGLVSVFFRDFKRPWAILVLLAMAGCDRAPENQVVRSYEQHCGSCHLAPDPAALPKDIWREQVLPEMGARMGINTSFDKLAGWSFAEQAAILKSGAYAARPMVSQEEWEAIVSHVLAGAPETLSVEQPPERDTLTGFTPHLIQFDSLDNAYYTYLDIQDGTNTILTGGMRGEITSYPLFGKAIRETKRIPSGVTDIDKLGVERLVTSVGVLTPTEIPSGRLVLESGGRYQPVGPMLHRPVHTQVADLNGDKREEILVCEYGSLNGGLVLLHEAAGKWERKVLLGIPGAIRTRVTDLDGDGDLDIAAVFGQGQEGVYFFYQEGDLDFRMEKVLAFSPVSGCSWFELVDLDDDGDMDIITAHGDNADKSFVLKPYHGLRIHTNEGQNTFTERYFFPMPGATRVSAADFDGDGDVDFGLLSTFPDYGANPIQNFVFLECLNWEQRKYEPHGLPGTEKARWLLMEAGDVDGDSDTDLVLSAFQFNFSPVPDTYQEMWSEEKVDLLLLENNLYSGDEIDSPGS